LLQSAHVGPELALERKPPVAPQLRRCAPPGLDPQADAEENHDDRYDEQDDEHFSSNG
jgi:hypothetical protein